MLPAVETNKLNKKQSNQLTNKTNKHTKKRTPVSRMCTHPGIPGVVTASRPCIPTNVQLPTNLLTFKHNVQLKLKLNSAVLGQSAEGWEFV